MEAGNGIEHCCLGTQRFRRYVPGKQTILIHRQAAEFHTCRLKGVNGIQIGRLLQQDGRAAGQQAQRDQMKALERAGGDQNGGGVRLNSAFEQLTAYGAAEDGAAERLLIGQRRQRPGGELGQHTGHGRPGQQPGRRLTGAEADQARLILQPVNGLYCWQIGIVGAFFQIIIPIAERLSCICLSVCLYSGNPGSAAASAFNQPPLSQHPQRSY
ncbi:hypothetical protein D3C75_526900 [compost metagenome]